jgi:signal transduction histidine kinase
MKKTILIVDDEKDIRDVLTITLADIGYQVLTAENGQTALYLFQREHPSIVMTDIKMPVMDGIELLRRIKQENRETEVIMVTGHGDMDLAIKSLKNDAVDFITKPINVDIMEIALKKVEEKILSREKLLAYTEKLETLVREKMELRDHLSALGLMIGSISHGIKGLLTRLDAGIYLVESGLNKNDVDEVAEGWEVVKLVVERIRKMIQDILFYAKKRDLEWKQVDAAVFADEVAKTIEPKIKTRKIDFRLDFDPEAGQFFIDPGFLHSALVNILDNAVDACLKDTSQPDHSIIFRMRPDMDNILFEVHDNGIGMDSATFEKIFTLFYSSKGRKGTGLGLFIANKIVRQHGGRITVKSTLGKGSRFTVHIPKEIPVDDESAVIGEAVR